ncbi:MAG: amino acid adenylation domain-containing protein, partial [Algicola sp.]|nr:amino acid adenylation domain-containing protein [Algicola sp.]
APVSTIERLLAQAWSQVLSVEQVGIHDNFFSLGGDSILSIRVVSLLKRSDVYLTIKDLFTYQSIAQLSAYIGANQDNQDNQDSVATVAAFELLTEHERALILDGDIDDNVEDAYPLSTLQAGMVFHTQFAGFNGVYHDINAEHIGCPWDQPLFAQALTDCMAAHPILRSRYQLSGTRALQLVYRQVALPLVVEDICQMDEDAQQHYLQQWQQNHQCHEFDWVQGPLFQVNIFRRTEKSFAFALSFHHSLLDGWSRASLTTTLYNRYRSLLALKQQAGTEENTPVLAPMRHETIYRQYIASELRALKSETARDYFIDMLVDAPSQQLPVLRAVSDDDSTYGTVQVAAFNPRSAQLIALAANLGVPVPVVLQALHFKVLACVSGHVDVMSNVVNNGRPEIDGGEQALGLFLNSLPMVVNLKPGSWRDLINQVMNISNHNITHRHYPLARISQDSGLTFTEVLFNYTHFHVFDQITEVDSSEAMTLLDSSGFEQTNYHFTVDMQRGTGDNGIALHFNYDSARYSEAFIAKMGDYFVRAADALLNDVDSDCYSLNLLSTAESDHLLHQLNVTQTMPAVACIHQAFEAQVSRAPQAIALEFEDQQISYTELNRRANQLADHLVTNHQVKPDTLVGICLERSVEMVMAILAVLKAGGAYVPLDPDYPESRLSYMLGDAQLKTVITQLPLLAKTPISQAQALCLDGQAYLDCLPTLGESNLPVQSLGLNPGHLAYVIYTSGSTGQPKGVMVTHANVHRLLSSCQQEFNFSHSDCFCLFHSCSFDFSVWELWGALTYGGRLVVVPQWVARAPEEFYQLVQQSAITILNQTPTAFIQFSHQDQEQHSKQENSELALRAVVFGGEALNLSELSGWVSRHGDAAPVLVNMYGITETTVHVTYRRILAQDIVANQGSLIGRPLADLKVYVLDRALQLVPLGTPGEMYVGGAGVTRGYLNNAPLTAERFIDNPYCAGERLYCTGDLACYLPSGELQYKGRIDEQVKIRGFRIELGEIEQQLSSLTLIDSSIVIVHQREQAQEQQNSKQIVAYIKAADVLVEGNIVDQVRELLRKTLPIYMIPAIFVVVEDWPLTVNGKVNKARLPAIDFSDLQADYVAPRDAREQLLCDIWQDALNIEQVGIEDNFFNLGGDSIVSISVVAQVKAQGLELSVKQLFEYPTVILLAEQLTEQQGKNDEITPFSLLTDQERDLFAQDHQHVIDAYPLSQLQSGMVFHSQRAGFDGVYHDIMGEYVRCPWQRDAFESALQALIDAHPLLRTGFKLWGKRPLQTVFKSIDIPLIVQDIKDLDESAQQQTIASWTDQRKRHEFDWENGPLFQFNIFLRSDDSFEFVFSFHHAILDGWSVATLNTNLFNYYTQLLLGKTPPVMAQEWVYRQFIDLEQRSLRSDEARDYFNTMLESAPVLQLPYKAQADLTKTREQQTLIVAPMKAFSTPLAQLSKQMNVPLQSVLLAIHFKVLAQVSGQAQVVSCVTHNGRPEEADSERGLGLFLNSLPLSLTLPGGSWSELIQAVAALGRNSLNHRRYPLS